MLVGRGPCPLLRRGAHSCAVPVACATAGCGGSVAGVAVPPDAFRSGVDPSCAGTSRRLPGHGADFQGDRNHSSVSVTHTLRAHSAGLLHPSGNAHPKMSQETARAASGREPCKRVTPRIHRAIGARCMTLSGDVGTPARGHVPGSGRHFCASPPSSATSHRSGVVRVDHSARTHRRGADHRSRPGPAPADFGFANATLPGSKHEQGGGHGRVLDAAARREGGRRGMPRRPTEELPCRVS
jgi:hypothetical protein